MKIKLDTHKKVVLLEAVKAGEIGAEELEKWLAEADTRTPEEIAANIERMRPLIDTIINEIKK